MKKLILSIFALLIAASAVAGALSTVAQGQGGGKAIKDATGAQAVTEVYQRGVRWAAPVAYSQAATDSASGITLTGASSTYKGPYLVSIVPTSATVWLRGATAATAITSVLPVVACQTTATQPYIFPLAPTMTHFHLVGATATATGYYSIGFYE